MRIEKKPEFVSISERLHAILCQHGLIIHILYDLFQYKTVCLHIIYYQDDGFFLFLKT